MFLNEEILCVLCVSAVNAAFIDDRYSLDRVCPTMDWVQFPLFPHDRDSQVTREKVCSVWPFEHEFDQLAIAVMELQQGGVG